MLCAEIQGQSLVIVGPASDPAQCQAVVLTGSESSLLSLFAFPSPTDSGTVWALGFSLVVLPYLVAWGCGAVLSAIRR